MSVMTFAGRSKRSSEDRRKFCCLGRPVLDFRLHPGSAAEKGIAASHLLTLTTYATSPLMGCLPDGIFASPAELKHGLCTSCKALQCTGEVGGLQSYTVFCLQEDPWNSIAAGALTGGFLQLRTGLRSSAKSAAFGGALLVSSLCPFDSIFHHLHS
jgi:hypothetical protein